MALNQGRYTWRHDNVIKYIVDSIDKSKFTVHSDLSGYTTPNGGTIPTTLTVTTLIPDITVLSVEKKSFDILELTVPFEDNIHARHKYKADKYAHYTTDISTHKTAVTAFEVGARGYLTEDNTKRLKEIYKLTMKKVSQKTFLQTCSALAIQGSFYIFTAHKEPTWSSPGFLSTPLK